MPAPDTLWDAVAFVKGSYQDCALTGTPAARRTYGTSGARAPATSAAGTNGSRTSGRTAAGWARVNGTAQEGGTSGGGHRGRSAARLTSDPGLTTSTAAASCTAPPCGGPRRR